MLRPLPFLTKHVGGNSGVAVVGTKIYVCNSAQADVIGYALLDGEASEPLAFPAFQCLQKMCASPQGTLCVADSKAGVVHEVSVSGAYIRAVHTGVGTTCVAVDDSGVLVVGARGRISMHLFHSGAHLRDVDISCIGLGVVKGLFAGRGAAPFLAATSAGILEFDGDREPSLVGCPCEDMAQIGAHVLRVNWEEQVFFVSEGVSTPVARPTAIAVSGEEAYVVGTSSAGVWVGTPSAHFP